MIFYYTDGEIIAENDQNCDVNCRDFLSFLLYLCFCQNHMADCRKCGHMKDIQRHIDDHN